MSGHTGQTLEWWSHRTREEFGALAVGNFDHAADGGLKIATGSFEGLLRFYSPSQPGYRVEDLMLEAQLSEPILQLGAGRFVAETTEGTLLAQVERWDLRTECASVFRATGFAISCCSRPPPNNDNPKLEAARWI